MRPSMSICTPRAWPSSGRNSEYGKLEPTISSVSQPIIMSQLGFVPEQADRAGDERQVVGHDRLAEQRLRDAGAEQSATAITSSAAPSAPAPTSIATFSPAFRIVGGALAGRRRRARRPAASSRRDEWIVPCACGGVSTASIACDVVRDDHAGHRALVAWRSASPGRPDGGSAPARSPSRTYSCATSLNSETQIDLLLVAAAQRGARLLADDRDDRLVVELRVVETVQEVDRARARTSPGRRPPRR